MKRKRPLRIPRGAVALGIFALIVVGGPLLFGAVDRLPQIGLLGLLGVGILVQPPAIVPLSRWGNRLALAFVVLLIFKEFAPASCFGGASWRSTLTQQYGLELPFTHHPEPARALDALLAGAVGVVWFLWVRRLAAERHHRAVLAWTLFAAAGIVAVVSFSTQHPGGSKVIYEGTKLARLTYGWSGFGPFPNRNHTADFFAMAAALGCGCLAWAAVRKQRSLFCGGLVLLGVIVVALLTTQSRGGLVAFGAGLVIFLMLCLVKSRNRRTLGASLAAALFIAAIMLTFGGKVFARFQSQEVGEISNQTRKALWHDTLGMWRDAPLLGHGLDSFTNIFPLYQKIELENQVVLHPESSWLAWLTELGLLPVLLAVAGVLVFLGRQWPALFGRHRSFYLHAGGFAAFAVLLVHAIFDMPAHRWGTAGFALAALAVACPMPLEKRRGQEPRQAALVPLVVAAFWCLPIYWQVPAWSPLCLNRLIELDALSPGLVQLAELQKALHYFPLNAALHQSVGMRVLRVAGRSHAALWQHHFALALRLEPSVWEVPVAEARACKAIAPMQAVSYWQDAVERGGIHRDEILTMAVRETGLSPAAQAAWGNFVEAHPNSLLAYAQIVPPTFGRHYYELWWKLRSGAPDLTPAELQSFYALAARWGNREEFDEWAKHHGASGVRDYRQWAGLLRTWGQDDRAWQLMSLKVVDPAFPAATPNVPRAMLESIWRTTPENVVNAQHLALVRKNAGEEAESDEIIVTVAYDDAAPAWFINKAAWILARSGHPGEAVDLLLRPR